MVSLQEARTQEWQVRLARGIYQSITTVWRLVMPRLIRERLDAEHYSNDRFAREVGAHLAAGAAVLDAGAGTCPYKSYFGHVRYYATDIKMSHSPNSRPRYDFLCTVERLPVRADWADAVLSFQVLEHVRKPSDVLREFHRILRPGGQLYLTVPQGWGLHLEPHHYFNFTRYGLQYLLEEAGFVEIQVEERGGLFWLLGKRLRMLPYYILFQYVYPLVVRRRPLPRNLRKSVFYNLGMILFVLPLYMVSYPFLGILFPLLFFYLDRLDRMRLFCLGYKCIAVKPTP